MSVLAVDFKKSRVAEEQRQVRSIIRKIPRESLTKGERAVLMVVVNLWFYHRNGPKGYIHPGRKLIAKRADVCIRTAATALERLRAVGVVAPIKYAKGGTLATQYTVDLMRLREVYDPCGVKEVDGDLIQFPARNTETNCTVQNLKIARFTPCENCTLSIGAERPCDKSDCPSCGGGLANE